LGAGEVGGGGAGIDEDPVLLRVIWLIASATEEVGTSVITSTPSRSYHCRAMFDPTSGLFWWSAETISTLRPFSAALKSSVRHAGGDHRALARDVGIKAGAVVQDADLDVICACAEPAHGRPTRGKQ
jgi:hypothetical protein